MMNGLSRRAFLEVSARAAVGLVAFIPAARTLATSEKGTAVLRAQPERVPNYVQGRTVSVTPSKVKLSNHEGQVAIKITESTAVWKGAWGATEPIEPGDWLRIKGKRDSDSFIAEKIWVNITNRQGPVSSVVEQEDTVRIIHRDVRIGEAAILLDNHTLVITQHGELPFSRQQFPIRAGQPVQVVGLKLKDGSIKATRLFL